MILLYFCQRTDDFRRTQMTIWVFYSKIIYKILQIFSQIVRSLRPQSENLLLLTHYEQTRRTDSGTLSYVGDTM